MSTKISKAEVDKMIMEEVTKMMAKKKYLERLHQINEELKKMDAEDATLNEVQAGGMQKLEPGQSFGGGEGEKFKPEFQKKGSSLLEDGDGMGEFEAAFAKIGKEIDDKMKAIEGGETEDTGAIEIKGDEVDAPSASGDGFDEVEIEDGDKTGEEENGKEPVEENKATAPKASDSTIAEAGENTKKGLEPIEGKSVVQVADENKVGAPYEDKADIKGEAKSAATTEPVIAEGKVAGTKNFLTEGMDDAKKTKILEELARTRRLAGLTSDDEGIEIIK